MNNKLDKIADPVSYYKNPIDVDKDDELTDSEKIKVLKNWIDDIKLRQTADNENMAAPQNHRYHMAEIERLLWKYEQQSNK
jgi:hypothetical protein